MLNPSPLFRAALPFALMLLAGCTGGMGTGPDGKPSGPPMIRAGELPVTPTGSEDTVKVAMLLPLTGKGAPMGLAMQNAAQLALNDLGYPHYELLFEDTGSTPGGAEKAARTATAAGAKLLIGPIFAEEAKAARPEAEKSGASLITFSTDTSVASPHTFVMGILPQDQARQIAEFAARSSARTILVIAERNAYGQIVTNAFARAAAAHNLNIAGTLWADGTLTTLPGQIAPYFVSGGTPVDAVFMPLPPERTARLNRMIKTISNTDKVLRLATGLLDDANITVYPDLVGTYYAAPARGARARFEQSYRRAFGDTPPRLASLGYDAVALSLMMARTHGAAGLTPAALTGANGFTGIDGLFRFRSDGIVERGLAIIQIEAGGRVIAAPSPTTFTTRP